MTGGDYGPIFMADNLIVTPWTTPYARIDKISAMSGGHMLLQGASNPFAVIKVQTTDNLAKSFVDLASITVGSDGTWQFEDVDASLYPRRFYRVVYP